MLISKHDSFRESLRVDLSIKRSTIVDDDPKYMLRTSILSVVNWLKAFHYMLECALVSRWRAVFICTPLSCCSVSRRIYQRAREKNRQVVLRTKPRCHRKIRHSKLDDPCSHVVPKLISTTMFSMGHFQSTAYIIVKPTRASWPG